MDKKETKILVLFAIAVLIGAAFSGCIGGPKFEEVKGFSMDDIGKISAERNMDATPVIASEENAFYALIGTPVAEYYYSNDIHVAPLLVENFSNPSRPVVRFGKQYPFSSDIKIAGGSPEDVSTDIAQSVWKKSDAVVLIEDSKDGYNLGVAATPIASYLDIPVMVTNDTNNVRNVLNKLGVKYTFLCGNIEGHERTWRFTDEQQITNFLIDLVKEKFGEVKYITITNPMDATMPKVLNRTTYHFSGTLGSVAILPSTLISTAKGFLQPGYHNFTIPDGYKYAHVKIDLVNLNSQDVEDLGDYLTLSGGPCIDDLPVEQQLYELVYITTMSGVPERDKSGHIIKDKVHYETVLYDRDGVTFDLSVMGTWLAQKEGSYELDVTVESLDNPFVPTMKKLSSVAPYLTAYRKGIILAKPEFAFAANDNVTVNGKTCPGFYVPRKNPMLAKASNDHLWEMHEMINELLGNLSDIPPDNVKELKEYYEENPVYIALVGGATMIPQYMYENPDTPLDDPMVIYYFGYGTPSDFIYGDIDPNPNDIKNDSYSYWPYQENIVGRITGWDIQDASALIARTIFYEEIIKGLGDWKNKATVQTGCGTDFQKIPVLEQIKNILGPLLGGHPGDPMKFPSGATRFSGDAVTANIKKGEFDVTRTYFTQSQRVGYSDEALNKIKKAGVLNMLLFPKFEIKLVSGENVVKGGEYQKESNVIYENGHGSMHLYEFGDVFMWGLGLGYFFGPLIMEYVTRISMFASPLGGLGTYSTRGVENMDLGPSTMMIESCVNGKIDGMYVQNNVGQSYIHAGVNTLLASSTFTNVAGYLNPRPFQNSFGIIAYVKAWYDLLAKGEYPRDNFGIIIHTDFLNDLIQNNSDVGKAFRDARNTYLPKDANSTFLWVPPLEGSYGGVLKPSSKGTRVLDKKYNTFLEYVLFGDPAFNPYQPVNNG
ncbi:MAG: C25 family cysteine peptidase [Candidatus Thermoplasmatota archaeon]|nr:C25 family cysteine peptidase [Candidatus Thermoplasmatota archaeon]